MTLIEVRNNGTLIGRCDARCYNATGGGCDCVCDGLCHGIGLEKALDAVSAIVDDYISLGYAVRRAQIQLELFAT